MDSTGARELIELASFHSAKSPDGVPSDQELRRFCRLISDPDAPAHEGASSRVRRMQDTEGNALALKTLRPLRTDDEARRPERESAREAAFEEEYENQLSVSRVPGFPELYGRGRTQDGPAILMEWIEGVPLRSALLDPVRSGGASAGNGTPARVCGWEGRAVAALGRAVLKILIDAQAASPGFAHRDLSTRNIMLSTERRGVTQQIEQGDFDVRLVDLGSAVRMPDSDGSFTMLADVWRNGTPDYAPPEMLTRDVPGIDLFRHSPAIDVYALGSILYELYSLSVPFDALGHPEMSIFRLKMDTDVAPLEPRCDGDAELCSIILASLEADPARRPTLESMDAALGAWISKDETRRRAGRAAAIPEEGACSCDAGDADAIPASETDSALALLEPCGGISLSEMDRRAARRASTETVPTSDGANADEKAANDGKRAISRRGLIAIGGLAALGIGAAGIATKGFGLLGSTRRSVDSYSWKELSEIAAEIADGNDSDERIEIARHYGLCDEDDMIVRDRVKPVEVGGDSLTVRVLGIGADVRMDGTRCGLTFMFDEILPDQRPMSDDPTYTAGWEGCSMRAWLNGDFIELLPEDLAGIIAPVEKFTNNSGAATSPDEVTRTEDRVWLPSYVELVGPRERVSFTEEYHYLADIMNGEGRQYKLFQDQGVLYRGSYDSFVRNRNGKPGYWWLRTPSPDVSESEGVTYFNRTSTNGDPFHYATPASRKSGVLPCFCI